MNQNDKTNIIAIDPSTKTVTQIEINGCTSGALFDAFSYDGAAAAQFNDTDMVMVNPVGYIDGTGIKDGVFYVNGKWGTALIAGRAYLFGGRDPAGAEVDDPREHLVKAPSLSVEDVQKLVNWDKPADFDAEVKPINDKGQAAFASMFGQRANLLSADELAQYSDSNNDASEDDQEGAGDDAELAALEQALGLTE